MNRHLKVAFMVAPILLVLGWGGADFYEESKANETRFIELKPEGHCDVINESCVLKSGEFKVNVFDKDGVTVVNSTFPLDTATLFLVDENDKMTTYQLGMKLTPYYWSRETPLRQLVSNKGDGYKLRLLAQIKGGQYISEFYTKTAK